jgi:exodeoxyribonuclease V alpha subunit
MSVRFECTPQRCIYNSENYKIYACDVDTVKYPSIKLNQYYNVSIAGDCGDLTLGMAYDIEANEKQGKYGYTYEIKYIKQQKPISESGLRQFLYACDLSYTQVDEIIREYPNIIELVMQNRTNEIDTSKLYNIGAYRINVIVNKIQQNFMLAEIVEKVGGYFSFNIIKKLFEHYGSTDKIIESLEQNPYECMCQINRVGFKTADKVLLGVENEINKNIKENKDIPFQFNNELKTSKDRCLSALTWLLDENETNGNTILNIKNAGTELKKLVPECFNYFIDICKNANDDEEMGKHIYVDLENKWIANKNTYLKENKCAEIIAQALHNPIKWNIDTSPYKNDGDIVLTDEQFNTLQMVCDNNISVLSGFAGSGKTQSTLSLIQMLKANNKSFLLLAPTGRASKVLSEYTKCPASTIHKLLFSMGDDEEGDGDYKIYSDIVIVDEVSMCDLFLFYRLLQKIDFTKTKMLLIGDEAQLPSVSAGNILYDIVHSKKVPVNSLTKIFRYGDNSILTVATDIRNSNSYLNKPLGDNKYIFVETPQETMVSKVKTLYKKLLETGYKMEDILILSAYNKGNYGTVAINNVLQPIVNKNINDESKYLLIKSGSNESENTKFCIGDVVIQIKNNYKAKLCNEKYEPIINKFDIIVEQTFIPNGEIGVIEHIDKNTVYIKFNDEMVFYDKSDMSNVKLAYSISIHKSQGGSAKIIILLTPKAHTYMLSSNLLYVGVTRAKEKVIHFGTAPTINMSIKKKVDLQRDTFMQNYIIENYDIFTNKQNNIMEDNNG